MNLLKLSRNFSLFKVPALENCDVLFVATPPHFMEPMGTVYTSDKLGAYIEGATLANFKVRTVLMEGAGSLRGPAAFEINSFPRTPMSFGFIRTSAWSRNFFIGVDTRIQSGTNSEIMCPPGVKFFQERDKSLS